jgi:hypothetical protein
MFLDHSQRRSTVGRTPLDEWSARPRDLYLTTHALTTDKYPCSRWDSNPRPQQVNGRRQGAWIFVCCDYRVLSGRGLCDELIARPEESYRLCCVVVSDLETSRIGASYIYDISNLRVNMKMYFRHKTKSSCPFACYIFLLWRCDPTRVMTSSFLRFSRSHTTTHHSR